MNPEERSVAMIDDFFRRQYLMPDNSGNKGNKPETLFVYRQETPQEFTIEPQAYTSFELGASFPVILNDDVATPPFRYTANAKIFLHLFAFAKVQASAGVENIVAALRVQSNDVLHTVASPNGEYRIEGNYFMRAGEALTLEIRADNRTDEPQTIIVQAVAIGGTRFHAVEKNIYQWL